jgi:hypothetical protein
MANFEYKNIDEILNNPFSRGNRISINTDPKKIIPNFKLKEGLELIASSREFGDSSDVLRAKYELGSLMMESIEMHVFLQNGAYLRSIYDLTTWTMDDANLYLDIHKDVQSLNLPPSTYKIVYNFIRNFIGSPTSPIKLFVSEISDDRREIQLKLTSIGNRIYVDALTNFVLDYLKGSTFLPKVVLNFGENKILDAINITSNGSTDSFFIKLFEPLPLDLDLYYECWLGTEIMKPYIDTVQVLSEEENREAKGIKGPNFEVEYDYSIITETDYKSMTEILSSNTKTSQDLLNKYVFGTGSYVKLNINFREFENFVFYSSANDRLQNFYYKIGLIEYYKNELELLEQYTGSVDQNKIQLNGLLNDVISKFDEFEEYLYYETTSSNYYTSQANATITPFPKYLVTGSNFDIVNPVGKFRLYGLATDEVEGWYTGLQESASYFDSTNRNALRYSIPEFIREDSENAKYVSFINMIGQHFDILYFYVDHILTKNLREEHPKDGLSQDLVYHAARDLGWKPMHGSQAKDLWEYALGISGSGDPINTGKTTVNKELSKSYEDRTKEVWRRLLNNLPYIYKSKGTARSIRAILAAYGIPQTVLTLREYGGPDKADVDIIPKAEWEKHTYYLNLLGSHTTGRKNSVKVPWETVQNANNIWQYPDTLTFRWKMKPDDVYGYSLDPIQTVLQKNSGSRLDWFVTVHHDGTDIGKGSLNFYIGDGTKYATASIYDQYLYDDIPLNIMIRRNTSDDTTSTNQIYDFILKTEKYGKLVIEQSASIVVSGSVSSSYNQAWASNGQLYIGSGSNKQTNKILSGSIYELRYWTKQLQTSSFDNHVLAPRSYNGNNPTASFYDLSAQFKFWQKINLDAISSLTSTHPNQKQKTFYSSSKTAVLTDFYSDQYESTVENYKMEVSSLGSNTIFSEKVRIDSGSLVSGLSIDRSSEISKFDRQSPDSNKLMIAFSPQHIINEDIYEAIGNTSLDDYIGDYSSLYSNQYEDLKRFSKEYWKKYDNKNDFTAYINLIALFDFSVFDQIRHVLPARTNDILGLVIEPNILERSRIATPNNITIESHEKFVLDTNEIRKIPTPTGISNSKTTTIYVGFDENDGSVLNEIEGEQDITIEVESDTQDIDGEYDYNLTTLGINNKKETTLYGLSVAPKMEYAKYTTNLYGGIGDIIPTYHYYKSTINIASAKLATTITSDAVTTKTYAQFTIAHSNNWKRINVNPSKENSSKYGAFWVGVDNDNLKSTGIFEMFGENRYYKYYSTFIKSYDTIKDYNDGNISTLTYNTTSVQHAGPNSISTGIKNHRYSGCKITDPDINNPSTPPSVPGGGPIVEVIINCSYRQDCTVDCSEYCDE